MIAPLILGRPGVGNVSSATQTFVFRDGEIAFLAGGRYIDGPSSRDPGNDPNVTTLRPGLLMGRLTASGYYAPSIIGLTLAASAGGATSLTLSPADATELVRRRGGSGTFKLTGPPTAAGTVATQTVTYSGVNTTTGVVTTSAISAATVIGSLVQAADGSELPITLIPDGYGISFSPITPPAVVEFPRVPIGGVIDDYRIPNWPADLSSRAYLRQLLSTASAGKFVFADLY